MEASLSIPDEEGFTGTRETFHELVARLSRLSVTKHYDAYADVPWDDPAYRIDADDPRWEAGDDSALGATDWYKSQPPQVRSRIGLHTVVCSMQIGVEFENILTRGLLGFAIKLPVGAPEFRYVYHEAIEESHHSLMFREFVTRAGLDPGKRGALKRAGAARVIRLAQRFPELFFLFVLGGEDPIDHVQRSLLRKDVPPLLRRMMQIHITEEARHLCFARAYLRTRVPQLGPWRRQIMAIGAPLILGRMAREMLDPPPIVARTYDIPKSVLAEAYGDGEIHRALVRASLDKVRALCSELDLVTTLSRPLWRSLQIA
ncbi:MAG TPA: diiron oxygenase [Polyangiaceae bacterium]|nr:diiron oxygenase [Polyangiaceae bacterium]